jgi:hypothetical protein
MQQIASTQIFVVELSGRRIVVSSQNAGQAREAGALLLLGDARSPRRDALLVREPEEEERTAFETFARGSGLGGKGHLTAIPM